MSAFSEYLRAKDEYEFTVQKLSGRGAHGQYYVQKAYTKMITALRKVDPKDRNGERIGPCHTIAEGTYGGIDEHIYDGAITILSEMRKK